MQCYDKIDADNVLRVANPRNRETVKPSSNCCTSFAASSFEPIFGFPAALERDVANGIVANFFVFPRG